MRAVTFCLFLIGSGILPAQDLKPNPPIRSVRVETISTSRKGLTPISFATIAAAWQRNHVNLDVESPLDMASIDKAAQVIRDVYQDAGQAVRVDHRINQAPPRSVEVAFRVIELSNCK